MTAYHRIVIHNRKLFASHWYKAVFFFLALLFLLILFGQGFNELFASRTPVRLIVDTDMGVDDAAAIGWLLSQTRYPVEVVGITTVAGNTTVENVTNNVLTILDTVGRDDIPVIIGAGAPILQTPTKTGAFIHGPDGLWFVGFQNPHDLSGLPTDVSAFYCDNAQPDVTLIALGPLTNLAHALEVCPEEMKLFGQIVILGGAKTFGNIRPVAEFNIWQDPEAAHMVLTAGFSPNPLFIPRDTFDTFKITQKDIDKLAAQGTPLGQLLAGPLQFYADVQTGLGGSSAASVPDVPAVMYALDTSLGRSQSGLVKLIPGILEEHEPERLVRGQTIIGLHLSERVPMIADDTELGDLVDRMFSDPDFNFEAALGAILAREPDNAEVLTEIHQRRMHNLFMRFLTN